MKKLAQGLITIDGEQRKVFYVEFPIRPEHQLEIDELSLSCVYEFQVKTKKFGVFTEPKNEKAMRNYLGKYYSH